VLATLSGERAVELYRDTVAQSYEHQLATAAKAAPAKPYDPKAKYTVGDLVEHATFGAGVVRSVAASRVTIQFATSTKILVCGC